MTLFLSKACMLVERFRFRRTHHRSHRHHGGFTSGPGGHDPDAGLDRQGGPRHQEATYFAVMAAFTNLALSASQLGTKYLNRLFVIERGRYDELGVLMIVTSVLGLVLPVFAVWAIQPGESGRRRNVAERLKAFFAITRSRYPLQ